MRPLSLSVVCRVTHWASDLLLLVKGKKLENGYRE